MELKTKVNRLKREPSITRRFFMIRLSIFRMVLIMAVCALACRPANAENLEGFSFSETEALKSIVQIRAAQTDHHANSKAHTFASSLKELYTGEKTNGLSLIDKYLSRGVLNGYRFRIRVKDKSQYEGLERWRWWCVEAKPVVYAKTGDRKSFYCDVSGVIRAEDIGGGWGTAEMKRVPEDVIAKLSVPVAYRSNESRRQHHTDRGISTPNRSSDDPQKVHQNISVLKRPVEMFFGYENAFSDIREYFDKNGNRVWGELGIPSSKDTIFKNKTSEQWEIEARMYSQTIEKSLRSGKTGSIKVNFCYESGYKCLDIDWERVTKTPWGTRIRAYGEPKATLFPADPVLMRQLAEVFINNPRPKLTEPWDLLRDVFDDYREHGRYKNLVKEGTCNLDEGTVVFDDVPVGEWMIYARLECADEYWEDLRQNQTMEYYYHFHPACCDVWIEFINVDESKEAFRKLKFVSTFDHIINTVPCLY